MVLFLNSAFAFSIAELVDSAVHEFGHGFMALIFGRSPMIFAFSEQNASAPRLEQAAILSLGPLTSLVLGWLALAWSWNRSAQESGKFFWFWLAWSALMEFVNYLIVTPFLTIGDTAQIVALLHAPHWVSYFVSALGIAALFCLGGLARRHMLRLNSEQELRTTQQTRRYMRRTFYWPAILGTILTSLVFVGGRLSSVALGLLSALGTLDVIALAIRLGIKNTSAAVPPYSLIHFSVTQIVLYILI